MSPEQLDLINTIFILLKKLPKQELQQRITAINVITLYYDVKKRALFCYVWRGFFNTVVSPFVQATKPDITLCKTISFIKTDKRPKVCFVCIRTSHLTISKRVAEYANLGSLS